jgi:hypothetical protein
LVRKVGVRPKPPLLLRLHPLYNLLANKQLTINVIREYMLLDISGKHPREVWNLGS